MRIAFFTEYDNIGGGESNLMNLCSALNQHAEVVLFCDGKLYDQATARDIKCRRMSLHGKRWLRFLPFPSIDRALRRELAGFDIIHAYSLNVLPRLFLAGRPLVWTTHGYWERPAGMRARVISAFVERVITVSTDVDNGATFGAKQRKIFLGTPIEKTEPEKKIFDAQSIRVVCVGRFQRIKGQDLLLKAIHALALKNPDKMLTLELVGDVNGQDKADLEFRDEIRALAKSTRTPNLQVTFCGFQKDPKPYIRAADFVVIPSRYESFSMVAIEALACGKPVIAPNVGGPKDIVDQAELGMLFEAGSAGSLGEVLQSAISDFARFSFDACVSRAQDFSIERQVERHLQLYQEICRA
jgi:glycosyltransferase involved in cell wall biosynthesis